MLRALETQGTGFGILILSTVGAYHAPGQDVRRAVGQFNAIVEGQAMAGNRIKVILYTDSAASGTLGEDDTATFYFERRNPMEKFQYAGDDDNNTGTVGTYTSHTGTSPTPECCSACRGRRASQGPAKQA